MDTMQNPFVGLRPYESSDSLYYFGRGEQVKTLLRQLHQHRFVAVVGSSGSGKSSLIRAGLIPQLEAGFLVQERDQWLVARMKPGEEPIGNLVDGLGMEGNLLAAIREQGAQTILDLLTPQLANSDTNLFILVDQFEELFRFGLEQGKAEQRQEAEEFVALLLALARQQALPIYVCLTMRSDFLGDCDAFYGLPEAINQSQFLVPRLTRSQRQEVITHPVHLAGARIAPRLVDRLLNEGIDTRDDLPVLQHVLMRTWDAWAAAGGAGMLDIAHYEQVHTIHQAIDRHANEALEELGVLDVIDTVVAASFNWLRHYTPAPNQRWRIAKALFQALTTVDASNRRIRRPVHLHDVCALTGASPAEVMEVINTFRGQGRSFLVLSAENAAENPLIDISHESLIRQWETLSGWTDDEAEMAKTYLRLVEIEQLYQRKQTNLYREADLEQGLRWRKQLPAGKAARVWAQRYHPNFEAVMAFLTQSQQAEEQRLAAEKAEQERQAQLLREKAELEEQKRVLAEQQAQQQRKALTRTRWLSGIMAVLTVFMFITAWFAMKSADEANNKTLEANYNLAKVFEEKVFQLIPDKVIRGEELAQPRQIRAAWLYGLNAAVLSVPQGKQAVLPATLGRLSAIREQDLSTERKQTPSLNIGQVNALAYSPDGKVIASGSGDNTVRLWEAATGKELKTLSGHSDSVYALAYSPDGKVIASGSDDNTVRLWDAATGKALNTFNGHSDSVSTLAYSPDGKVIASGSGDKTVRLWDTATGKVLNTFSGHSDSVSALAYSPDSKVIASGLADGTVRLWDAATGKALNTLSGHSVDVSALAYSPDGKVIASGSIDGTVRLWYTSSGYPLKIQQKYTFQVTSVSYSPDGKVIASGLADGTVRLWNANSGYPLKTLQGYTDSLLSMAYSPDGKVIASGSRDGTIRLWDASSGNTLHTLKGYTDFVLSMAYSPDGKVIASALRDSTVRLWEVASNKELNTLSGHTSYVSELAYNPDGKVIASSSLDGTVRLWDMGTGEILKTLQDHTGSVLSVAYNPNGKVIATGSDDNNTVRLWDAATGKALNTLSGHADFVEALAYSPDGKVIASGSGDKTVRLWDAVTGKGLKTLSGHSDSVYALAYSPDGKVIASGSSDKTLRLWDATTGQELETLSGHTDSVSALAYSPDGKVIASGSEDNTVRLWDAATGKELKTLSGHSDSVYALAYSPDGKVIASGSGDKTVRLWELNSPVFRLIYDFDPAAVSAALCFVWEMQRDELQIKQQPHPPALFPELGYHITWTDETRKLRPLLDMPNPDETKLGQVVRFLEAQCAYQRAEDKQACEAKRQ
ncbi:WD40 domain-containing protein [Candidatus Thiothrix anitrata]|uniref:PQQ-binding-like beta-propeller repeat protein n=1 Tax=Candidatus Thiothrix anitrata TaxID=2823902 RepID=A0ABX7X535_9GAMM|nr:PQQ-binding-like beta-propeller repeat protein [Candidatus Thiothrix anitrata]QTR50994.1 PQQ-binding-like beta-propeller repeat protein [Candidatus Thiothrix anitrata]